MRDNNAWDFFPCGVLGRAVDVLASFPKVVCTGTGEFGFWEGHEKIWES